MVWQESAEGGHVVRSVVDQVTGFHCFPWLRSEMRSRHRLGLQNFLIHSRTKKAEGTGSCRLQQGLFIRVGVARPSRKDWAQKMERKYDGGCIQTTGERGVLSSGNGKPSS